MAEEDDGNEYRWETGYEKTWEAIKEDDDGLLDASVAEIIQRAKRKRQAAKCANIRLGMMRHLYIIIDWSDCMSNQDLKPTRNLCTIKLLEGFIEEFFDQNPISQIGIITSKNKRAEKISELAGNPRKHIKAVQALKDVPVGGEMSLQNSLELALGSLRNLPSHASREILVIMGSLTTCDPRNITDTIADLKDNGVQCSVIGLAAEVHICHLLTKQTKGQFGVILDDCHYRDLLNAHIDPPAAVTCQDASLVKMGFPHHLMHDGKGPPLSTCMCHVDQEGESASLTKEGYFCPQCCSKYCELPVECIVCGLTLVSAPHLARSYHHLFPVHNYKELEYAQNKEKAVNCFACQKTFTDHDKTAYECGRCKKIFCLDCDLFVHDTLHTCPGCATSYSGYLPNHVAEDTGHSAGTGTFLAQHNGQKRK